MDTYESKDFENNLTDLSQVNILLRGLELTTDQWNQKEKEGKLTPENQALFIELATKALQKIDELYLSAIRSPADGLWFSKNRNKIIDRLQSIDWFPKLILDPASSDDTDFIETKPSNN